jgi:hypothetical protein
MDRKELLEIKNELVTITKRVENALNIPVDADGKQIEVGKTYVHIYSHYVQRVDRILKDHVETTDILGGSRLTSPPCDLIEVSEKEVPYFAVKKVWHKEYGELRVDHPQFCHNNKVWTLVCINSKGGIRDFRFEDLSLVVPQIRLCDCNPGDIYKLQESGSTLHYWVGEDGTVFARDKDTGNIFVARGKASDYVVGKKVGNVSNLKLV